MLLRRSAPILRSCARGTTLRSFPARPFTPTTTTSVLARAASSHAHTGQAFDFDTLVDMQQKSCFTYGDRPFLGSKPMQGGPYEWVTYRQFGQMVDQCRAAMKQSGVTAGDKVAVISSNRVEWAVGAYGAFSLGASYVPMYEQQRVSECEYILKDSGAKLLLVSKETIYDKVQPLRSSLPGLKDVWCFDLDFHPRLKAQVDPAATPPTHPRPSDVATVIYTSGTTGVPKGVALSHRNLVADIQAMNEVVPHDALPEVRSLSFLPWAHCIGKNCELHNMMQRGGQVALAQDLSTIADNIQEVQPTILFAVPTLFKKVYDKMMAKISDSGVLTRALVHTALNVAERRRAVLQEGREPHALLEVQHRLLQRAVIDKLRQPLGGKLQISPVGGSAMNVEVARFFENIGVGILEGYGLTETSPLLTLNGFQVRDRRMGTVGRPIPGAEVAIVTEDGHRAKDGHEGEIWAAGPMVFSGYHNKPHETEMAFGELDGKRWFKTGDLGKFIKGGFLKITGRVKELYKLENGKYVAPAVVEKALLENSLVTQVLLYGANRPYNIALIYPNWDKLRQLALERKVPGVHPESTVAEMKLNDDLQSVMMEAVTLACKDRVKKYEIPAKVVLLTEPFSVENEMLTPKMSVKRHVVVRHYSAAIEQLYKEAPAPAAAHVTRRARDDEEEDTHDVEGHHTPRPLAA